MSDGRQRRLEQRIDNAQWIAPAALPPKPPVAVRVRDRLLLECVAYRHGPSGNPWPDPTVDTDSASAVETFDDEEYPDESGRYPGMLKAAEILMGKNWAATFERDLHRLVNEPGLPAAGQRSARHLHVATDEVLRPQLVDSPADDLAAEQPDEERARIQLLRELDSYRESFDDYGTYSRQGILRAVRIVKGDDVGWSRVQRVYEQGDPATWRRPRTEWGE